MSWSIRAATSLTLGATLAWHRQMYCKKPRRMIALWRCSTGKIAEWPFKNPLSLSCPVSSFAHANIRPDRPPCTDVCATGKRLSSCSDNSRSDYHIIQRPSSTDLEWDRRGDRFDDTYLVMFVYSGVVASRMHTTMCHVYRMAFVWKLTMWTNRHCTHPC